MRPLLAQPPPGFIHVDLDGLWTLAGCYGFAEDGLFEDDPVFAVGLARLTGLFDELSIKATFFVSGRDLESPAKRQAIAELARQGHELANHGWSHRMDLEDADSASLDREIGTTSRALADLTGRAPLGYRAPGYAAGPAVLAACVRAGLRYDGSRLPTPWGWALRWLAGRMRAQVGRELGLKNLPKTASGQYGHGGPARPVWEQSAAGYPPILRLPLAVWPGLGFPLQASMGMLAGERFVRGGLRRLARRGQPVTWLLHGLDGLGAGDFAGRLPAALARTRAFGADLDSKLAFLRAVLLELKSITRIELTRDWFERTYPSP